LKIVITAAGQSQRFYDAGYSFPKFMLPVFKTSILEQVINMFNHDDSFLIVTSNKLCKQFTEFFDSVSEKFRNLEVICVEPHNGGPVETLLNQRVQEWIGQDDFIVSYCDFFLNWNYKSFLDHIHSTKSQGCIVSFNGMQPASRGSTLFAYLRTRNEKVLEVREKSSFTDNRTKEYASAGIYYFKSYSIFHKAVTHSSRYFEHFSEKYVSLVYNGILDLGFEVSHFPVSQFICLGTPQDYEEFLYWYEYFLTTQIPNIDSASIQYKLIPMAGFGQRFQNAGVSVPKPLIPVRNKAMFLHALESFPRSKKSCVVVMDDQIERINRALTSTWLDVTAIALTERTLGPGETILKAIESIPKEEDLLVMSCDYYLQCDPNVFEEAVNDRETKVILFYTYFSRFRMNNPEAFAYCSTDNQGIVQKIVEKELLSKNPGKDKLLVGSFWFRNQEYLKIALENSKVNNRYVNGELYVANSLNELLELGVRVRAIPVKHWISFGDPEEFEIYSWWENLFDTFNNEFNQIGGE